MQVRIVNPPIPPPREIQVQLTLSVAEAAMLHRAIGTENRAAVESRMQASSTRRRAPLDDLARTALCQEAHYRLYVALDEALRKVVP